MVGILAANSAVSGVFSIDNSLRFDDGSSTYLNRTQTAGNRRTWTWSGWIKRGVVDTRQTILSAGNDGNDESHLRFDATGYLRFKESTSNSPEFLLDTNALFRDPAAWYHIVVAVDTTQGTDSNRIKIYVNGSQVTSFNSPNYPSQNYDTRWNNNSQVTYLGMNVPDYRDYYDGYMAEVHFIDGTAKAPTDFGESDEDSGIWKPIRYSGSYGTNGYKLDFSNIGKIHTITAYGDVHHETDEQKIGTTSIEFDGTGDYLSANDIGQFRFGGGDFTIEFFAKMGDQANTFTTLFNDPSGGNKLRVDTGGSTTAPKLSFYSSAWDARTSGTTDLSDNAWHHCAIVRDNGTLRIFVDGTEEATRASSTQDVDSSGVFEIGRYNGGTRYFDGYLDEIRISNVARYTGSFTPTTSAFTSDVNTRLLIHSNSSDGNTTFTDDSGSDGGMGDDASGNNNDFTTTNISDYTDQTTDTPTNNFCTLNPLDNYWANATFSEGNCKMVAPGTGYGYPKSTIAVSSGKWYFEAKASDLSGNLFVGIASTTGTGTEQELGYSANDYGYKFTSGAIRTAGSENAYGGAITTSDILGVAFDLDNNKLYFSKNGTFQNSGDPAAGSNGFSITAASSTVLGKYSPSTSEINSNNSSTVAFNFGNPVFAISSGNSDGNGYGNFEYEPPSGFLALCTQNLATELSPTIDDGSAHFHTQLYTGNGVSGRAITNDANAGDFKPDWLWIKHRNHSTAHSNNIYNSTGGIKKMLGSNLDEAYYVNDENVQAFNTDGFTVGTQPGTNSDGINYKAWQWKANGGTTSSNDTGDITSTVQANTTAGFSIVTYTGTGSNATIGHGLGKVPAMMIVKGTDGSSRDWAVYHNGVLTPANARFHYVKFNNNSAYAGDGDYWNDTAPTTSVFTVGTSSHVNNSGSSYIAFIFAEIEGYSRFLSYTGNGNADGTFVYTGFKPAYLMVRRTDAGSDGWAVFDSARDPHNGVQYYEFINNGTAEGSGTVRLDFVSNGFKLRQSGSSWNAAAKNYLYMAFASNPFVSSSGVPNTAR